MVSSYCVFWIIWLRRCYGWSFIHPVYMMKITVNDILYILLSRWKECISAVINIILIGCEFYKNSCICCLKYNLHLIKKMDRIKKSIDVMKSIRIHQIYMMLMKMEYKERKKKKTESIRWYFKLSRCIRQKEYEMMLLDDNTVYSVRKS